MRVVDCNGNQRAGRLVKDWYTKTGFVFVVYDVTSEDSFQIAKEIVSEVANSGMGAQIVLFGNTYSSDIGPRTVNATEFAKQNRCLLLEGKDLIEAVNMVVNQLLGQSSARSPDERPSMLDSFKSWFGVKGSARSAGTSNGGGVLLCSLKGTKALKSALKDPEAISDLRPTQELQDSESAITCVCFGQEKVHKEFILLAAACKDGTVVIYRCYRTELEMQLLAKEGIAFNEVETTTGTANSIEVHCRLVGHTRAITSIFFNLLEDMVVTTSIDKSVRFWSVDNGEMLKVFTDSSPVPVACFLPFNPSVFVAANSNAVLRLVNVQNGMVLQKLKVETEVRALKFDDTGLFLLAGTKSGSIHVLEASDNSNLRFKFKLQLARGGITCITFVSAVNNQPPQLLVNSSDSSVTMVDCSYATGGVLTNLTVRHRVKVAHSLLPLKCCYSPSDGGYLISGSEDKSVYIYSLARNGNYKLTFLTHHQVPVVAVATNQQDTLLVSADSLGRIVFWRRFDLAHLAN